MKPFNNNFKVMEGDSPVLIHVPHAGLDVPEFAQGSMTIPATQLREEVFTLADRHTDFLAREMSQQSNKHGELGKTAGTVINRLSRLVVDPERFPDERETMNAVGMGAVYTRGSKGQQIRVDDFDIYQNLLDRYFHPYATALETVVDQKLTEHQKAILIDLHSYSSTPLPYELNPSSARPEICLGYDEYHCDDALLSKVTSVFEEAGFEVGRNDPFSGSYVPLKHYQTDNRVISIMLEIRRDMYMNEKTGELLKDEYMQLIKPLVTVVDFLNQM